ncbi:hypothetical protein QUF58_00890 [Anaerolineales bacterium HSG24]|nr:hypothetical protein [Anaerolineales bacterium HSG24]
MNLYFLVEGKLESKLYPKWLSYLLPELRQVKHFDAVTSNSYYLFNAKGYPKITEEDLPHAIANVNNIGLYDYLILCFDADEDTVEARQQDVYNTLTKQKIDLPIAKLEIVVQNRCAETWFLGNRKFYKLTPEDADLRAYTMFYNVADNDPELMPKHEQFHTIQQFHKAYFKRLCQERKVRFSEKLPGPVQEEAYLKQLIARVDETAHLNTFRHFYDLCQRIKQDSQYPTL